MECRKGLEQPVDCIHKAILDALARWRHRYRNITTASTMATDEAYHADDVQLISRATVQTIENLEIVAGRFQPADKGGSRSGASFFKTEEFFVKGFDRKSEYVEMVKFRKEFKKVHTGTTFVEPLLAFPAFGNYWVVTANAGFVFEHLLGNVFLKEETFDVKPEPLISESRSALLMHLVEVGFQPAASERLSAFDFTLANDLDFLERHQMCDWSWFIKSYKVDPDFADRVEAVGANLPEAAVSDNQRPWCFGASRPGIILCFALLDFSLNFETLSFWKKKESQAMRDKWKNYAGKFRDFTKCIFMMRPSEEELHKKLGLGERPEGSLVDIKSEPDIRKRFTYRVQVRPRSVDPAMGSRIGGTGDALDEYKHTKCYSYLRDACKPFFPTSVTWAGGCDFSVRPEAYKEGDVLDSHDEYWLVDTLKKKGDYCLGYLVEKCHQKKTRRQKDKIIGDKMNNFVFTRK